MHARKVRAGGRLELARNAALWLHRHLIALRKKTLPIEPYIGLQVGANDNEQGEVLQAPILGLDLPRGRDEAVLRPIVVEHEHPRPAVLAQLLGRLLGGRNQLPMRREFEAHPLKLV